MNDPFAAEAAEYYSQKLKLHGPTHRGVDWSSAESQERRFRELLRLCDGESPVDLNDYGCGYGAMVDYLQSTGRSFVYSGYDAAPLMIEAARARHAGNPRCEFTSDRAALPTRDYTVASGTFNVKQGAPPDLWWEYVSRVLDEIAGHSRRGFGFNLLTSYADPERQRPDLFYAEPEAVFGYCMTRFSRAVALLHDYRLYEFTILVRLR